MQTRLREEYDRMNAPICVGASINCEEITSYEVLRELELTNNVYGVEEVVEELTAEMEEEYK